jgi:hypothetical protein
VQEVEFLVNSLPDAFACQLRSHSHTPYQAV